MKRLILATALLLGSFATSTLNAAFMPGSKGVSANGSINATFEIEDWGDHDSDVGATIKLYRETSIGLELVAEAGGYAQYFGFIRHFPYASSYAYDPSIQINNGLYDGSALWGDITFSNLAEGEYRMEVEFVHYNGGETSCEVEQSYFWEGSYHEELSYWSYPYWAWEPQYAGSANCIANWY